VPAVVWGTSEIAKLINRTETQAGYLLRQGEIKCAIKKGTLWCASVEALRREFSGEVAS
jgi:hypothetical protein